MSQIQRGIVELLHDLDRRARPGREPKNRAISKFQTIADTVQLSSETITTTVQTPPYQYARQSYRSAVIADAPTAYWRLGENAPAVTANDEQGTYFGTAGTGTLFGRTGPGAGADANLAAYFDGSSGIISVAHSTTLNTSSSGFSVECWVLPSSSAVTTQDHVIKSNAAGTIFWILYQSSSGFTFSPNSGIDNISYTPVAGTFPVNAWSHLVGTWDGNSSASLYLNGARVASSVATSSGTASTGTVTIGGSTAFGQLFVGTIDEVAVYGTVMLTSTRVLAHYNAMITPTATGTSLVVGAGQFR